MRAVERRSRESDTAQQVAEHGRDLVPDEVIGKGELATIFATNSEGAKYAI
jgi:hypothetical protein